MIRRIFPFLSFRCSIPAMGPLCTLALLMALLAGPVQASKTLVVGVFDMEPLCSIHRGQPRGLLIGLIEEIARKENWTLQYLVDDLDSQRRHLERGAIDLLLGAPHDRQKDGDIAFSNETIISTWGQIYARQGKRVRTLLDLDGLSVGVVRGDPYAAELRRMVRRLNIQCRFVEFKQYVKIINAMAAGWIDAGALDRFFSTRQEDRSDVFLTPIIFAPVEICFASSKEDRLEIIGAIDYHLNRLKNATDSIYYRLLEEILGKTETGVMVSALKKGVAILGLFLVVSTGVGIFLRGQVRARTDELTQKNQELASELAQRREAESLARRNEARYRNVFENTGTATLIVEPDLTISKVNAMALSISGYGLEEIEGRMKITDFIAKETIETLAASRRNHGVTDAPSSREFEFQLTDKHGNSRDLFARIGCIDDSGQQVVSLIDMTERKRGEAERLRLATVLEQSCECVFVMDTDLIIRYCNPAFETICGYSRHEVYGCKPDFLFTADHTQEMLMHIRRCLASGKTWCGRISNQRKDGRQLITETKISPIRDPLGKISGYVNIKRDVTAEVQMEDQLRQTQKLQAIGRLAGGIAHDFNNILAGIMGFTELADMQTPADASTKRYYHEILNGCQRARDLVNQILTFSRQQQTEKMPIRLQSVVEEALKLITATIPSSIEIKTTFQAPKAVVFADATQIHQMVINLCTNAAHSMGDGGGALTVCLSETRVDSGSDPGFIGLKRGPYLLLSVSDMGRGMDKEVMDRLFEPFFTTKAQGQGTGLGLSVVHGIVKSHGGTIDVASEPGKGSTFFIRLPVSQETVPKESAPAPEPAAAGGNETILFVDDEPALGRIAKEGLEKIGYTVISTTSSTEAMGWIETQPDRFDLVITDRTMPNLSGIDLARKISAIREDLPVIMCTGFFDPKVEAATHSTGIVECLPKPLKANSLAAAVRRALIKN